MRTFDNSPYMKIIRLTRLKYRNEINCLIRGKELLEIIKNFAKKIEFDAIITEDYSSIYLKNSENIDIDDEEDTTEFSVMQKTKTSDPTMKKDSSGFSTITSNSNNQNPFKTLDSLPKTSGKNINYSFAVYNIIKHGKTWYEREGFETDRLRIDLEKFTRESAEGSEATKYTENWINPKNINWIKHLTLDIDDAKHEIEEYKKKEKNNKHLIHALLNGIIEFKDIKAKISTSSNIKEKQKVRTIDLLNNIEEKGKTIKQYANEIDNDEEQKYHLVNCFKDILTAFHIKIPIYVTYFVKKTNPFRNENIIKLIKRKSRKIRYTKKSYRKYTKNQKQKSKTKSKNRRTKRKTKYNTY